MQTNVFDVMLFYACFWFNIVMNRRVAAKQRYRRRWPAARPHWSWIHYISIIAHGWLHAPAST